MWGKNEAKTVDLERCSVKLPKITKRSPLKLRKKNSSIAWRFASFSAPHFSSVHSCFAQSMRSCVLSGIFSPPFVLALFVDCSSISGASKSVALFKWVLFDPLFRPPQCNSACAARFRWLARSAFLRLNRLPLHKRCAKPTTERIYRINDHQLPYSAFCCTAANACARSPIVCHLRNKNAQNARRARIKGPAGMRRISFENVVSPTEQQQIQFPCLRSNIVCVCVTSRRRLPCVPLTFLHVCHSPVRSIGNAQLKQQTKRISSVCLNCALSAHKGICYESAKPRAESDLGCETRSEHERCEK